MRVAVLAFNTENLQGRNLEERQPRRLFSLLGSRLNKLKKTQIGKGEIFSKPIPELKQSREVERSANISTVNCARRGAP